jgi:3D (Asp-Asp-Asp) domain-containing protein
MILFNGTAEANDKKSITVEENGIITQYKTNSETVQELMNEIEINIGKNDCISSPLNSNLINGSLIRIYHAYIQMVKINEQIRYYYVKYNKTVGELLNDMQNEFKEVFVCNNNNENYLKDCISVEFLSKHIKLIEEKENIPYQTEVILSDKLCKDQDKIKQIGCDGEKLLLYEVEYLNNKEISRKLIDEKTIREATKEVIIRGTAKKILSMNASAYTAGYESTGKHPGQKGYGITATGKKATHGVVAVDPNVIPLGSRLYVEGYGYAMAWDIGGAIKGNKIDLFYDDLAEAIKFGRKNLMVYVLT